jgi:ElaB/YqjD/DUF883 family membrane-anchored ribosome-binding protein
VQRSEHFEQYSRLVDRVFQTNKMSERKLRQLVHDCTTEYQVILSNMEELLSTVSKPSQKQRGHIRTIKEAMKRSTAIVHRMQNIIATELATQEQGKS